MAQEVQHPAVGQAVSDLERRAEEAGADYEVTLESLSQWQLAWRKFKKHRLALVGLGILVVLVLVAIIGPFLIPFDFATIPQPDEIVYAGRPPSLSHWFGETGGLQRDVFMLVVTALGRRCSSGSSRCSSPSSSGHSSAPWRVPR
jgi:hypothetical protein